MRLVLARAVSRASVGKVLRDELVELGDDARRAPFGEKRPLWNMCVADQSFGSLGSEGAVVECSLVSGLACAERG